MKKGVCRMEFHEILRELLEDNDITQKQLANDLGIGVTTIGNYVRGLREPDFDTLKLFAKYFNVTTDFLLDHRSGTLQTHEEDELIRLYRALSPSYKDLLKDQGKLLYKHNLNCNDKK